jgi:hypothetical protein
MPCRDDGAWSRRAFCAAGASGAAAWLAGCGDPTPPGTVLLPGAVAGHRLRDGTMPTPTREERAGIVVIGSGIAGLSAAREIHRLGAGPALVLELDGAPGGNSRAGANAVSAFPWGAHYLPLPGPEAPELTQWLEETGVITGRDASGLPIYDERQLCADPDERLFRLGRWDEGVIPAHGLSDAEREGITAFLAHMNAWRERRGSDGLPAFAVPASRGSLDPEVLALDRVTFAHYLDIHGFTSPAVRWYADYCCRDDYGAPADIVSAWAGIHYFAARRAAAANADGDAVLTWPEGNACLAQRLLDGAQAELRTGWAVFNVEADGPGVAIDCLHVGTNAAVRVRAAAAVCAVPRFVAARLIRPWREQGVRFDGIHYAPWAVANLTVDRLPGGRGVPPCWDNILHGTRSLGYVVATHQSLDSRPAGSVLTWYRPLDDAPPLEARRAAFARPHAEWCRMVFDDLRPAHPDIRERTQRLDVCVWGHGMVTPVPGFRTGATRRRMLEPWHAVAFAHTDMSGLSLFEEAFTLGIEAAGRAVRHWQERA